MKPANTRGGRIQLMPGLLTVSLVLVVILFSSIMMLLGEFKIPIFSLCLMMILSTYRATHLYWVNDSLMGGLQRTNYGYTFGFVVYFNGFVVTASGFLWGWDLLIYVGSAILLAGVVLLVASTNLLFNHIIRRGVRSQR